MDRSWIKNPDKLSVEYANGITEFVNVARQHLDSKGMTLCPCCRCINKQKQKINIIKIHLLKNGFLSTYNCWHYHGERLERVVKDVPAVADDVVDEHDNLAEGLNDAMNSEFFNIGATNDLDDYSCNVGDKYDDLFESLHKPLYENCKDFSVLSTVVKLMNIKVVNKITDKGIDEILKLLKELLPEGNHCPENYYQTRKLLCEVGLGYEQIDVCQYDCALFYGDNANAMSCPVCQSSRYVRNKVPHKRLRWFPIKARLKRLFSSKYTSKDMRWHKEVRKDEPGILRHPADGLAWKHFDSTYPNFAMDSRNVRMGLASDGFNPFSNLTSAYTLWPVILIPYNMPPWASPNGTNYLMSLLIPGPKSPGKDYDVFLQPLIKELKELWDGIDAYDAYTSSTFKLRAVVLWTISDFPAFAYLSGWSTAGKLACPVCLEDTRSKRITDKQCFTGHRCYLRSNHSWRKSKEYDGSSELRGPPRTFTGEDILEQLKEVPVCIPGKAPTNFSRKRKRGAKELNWSKRSVLFELPYWSTLMLRNNLDVMHIEKNVCDNIIGTLLDIESKTKDNVKARKDLEDLNIRPELWLKNTNNKIEKPHASYTLTREERKSFCKFIQSVRLPDGYASNISRCVTDDKLVGMKTHESHVLLHKILPVAIMPYLTKNIRGTLIELCQFFQKICSKTIRISDIQELKEGIIIILCKLEKIFPPSFFTIMVHLCVHLPEQVLQGGPVASRWMFGTERHMGLYKRYVRNMARPDGSIAEAVVVDEAVSFLARYVPNLVTRFNIPDRNWDLPVRHHHMDIFMSNVRQLGASTIQMLQTSRNAIQWYILNNCGDDIEEYLNEHRKILAERCQSESEVAIKQREEFPYWFRKKMSQMKVQNHPSVNNDLYSLSQGPLERYISYPGCVVNGVRFRCKQYDDTLRTQCSGVCVEIDHDNEVITYYGVLIEILQLSFLFDRKVFLFRCKWYNSNPKSRTIFVENNLVSINTASNWYSDEPYILASQAQQVFYLLDTQRGANWRIVQKVNHRSVYDIPETCDVVNDLLNNDVFQEEASFELPPFQPTEDEVESSSLVRSDVAALTIPNNMVADLLSRNHNSSTYRVTSLDEYEVDEDYDDGDIFNNEEEFIATSDESDSASETESETGS